MADIVLGIGTSHTPMLTLSADLWPSYARNDQRNPELAFPPHGLVMPYQEALDSIAPDRRAHYRGTEPFQAQAEACQRSLDDLSSTLRAVNPDITVRNHKKVISRKRNHFVQRENFGVGPLRRAGNASAPKKAVPMAKVNAMSQGIPIVGPLLNMIIGSRNERFVLHKRADLINRDRRL